VKGISNVVTTSTLILIAVALLVLVLPWAWSSITQTLDVLTAQSNAKSYAVLSDVYIIPPPAMNPKDVNQVAFVFNSGSSILTKVGVKMISPDMNMEDLEFYVIKRDGSEGSWTYTLNSFMPGDVLVVKVPAEKNYIGYQFLFYSQEYSEIYQVGG
jgi:hypothetical protein